MRFLLQKTQQILELEIELGLDHTKILKKFGVSTDKDLTEEQLDKMLKTLKDIKKKGEKNDSGTSI